MLEQPLEKTTVGYGPVCRQIPDLSQTRGALHLLRIQRGFCHRIKKEPITEMLIFATLPIGPIPLQVLFYRATKPALGPRRLDTTCSGVGRRASWCGCGTG